MSEAKRAVTGKNQVRRAWTGATGLSRRTVPPGLLDRTVQCRCLNAKGIRCAATFIPDELDYYREKHERDFHGCPS